jgi:hypothetical protein
VVPIVGRRIAHPADRPTRGQNSIKVGSWRSHLNLVITVSVKSANGDLFLRSFELPVDTTVISAAMGLDAKTAVRP